MSTVSPGWPRPPRLPRQAVRASRTKPLRAVGVVLLALLGFALATSVHSQRAASRLATARPDELVRLLDDLDARSSRLRAQVDQLSATESRLQGSGSAAAALAETRQRAEDLAILVGTIGAHGPGLTLTITDPQHAVDADVLVDVVEELRDAGAETLEISGVRVGATTAITNAAHGLAVDGRPVTSPYVVRAIGDPPTMQKALQIPGGITDTVGARSGAAAVITPAADVKITSLRPLAAARYAQPASH